MLKEQFEQLVAEEFPNAIPEKFRSRVSNVAFIVEDIPSLELRTREGLLANETLLGYYHGIPHTARGSSYGVGATLPDVITLFQVPITEVAMEQGGREEDVRRVIRETIWHEVAHHFGMDEFEVRDRESKRQT